MHTHFNEIYLESDKYPRATFKGVVPNFDLDKISPEGTFLKINGTIKIHGVSKPITVSGILKKTKNQLLFFIDIWCNNIFVMINAVIYVALAFLFLYLFSHLLKSFFKAVFVVLIIFILIVLLMSMKEPVVLLGKYQVYNFSFKQIK